jgi:hypothetical protein
MDDVAVRRALSARIDRGRVLIGDWIVTSK